MMKFVRFYVIIATALTVSIKADSPEKHCKKCLIKSIADFVNYVQLTVNSTETLISDMYRKTQANLELLTNEFQAYMSNVYGKRVLQIQLAQQSSIENGKDISTCNVDQNILQMQNSLNVMYYEFTLCSKAVGSDLINHLDNSKSQLNFELLNVQELQNEAFAITNKDDCEVLEAKFHLEKLRVRQEIKNNSDSIIAQLNGVHDQFLKCVKIGMERIAIGLDDPHDTVMSCLYSA